MDVFNVGKQPTIVFDTMPVVDTDAYVRRVTEINGLVRIFGQPIAPPCLAVSVVSTCVHADDR